MKLLRPNTAYVVSSLSLFIVGDFCFYIVFYRLVSIRVRLGVYGSFGMVGFLLVAHNPKRPPMLNKKNTHGLTKFLMSSWGPK